MKAGRELDALIAEKVFGYYVENFIWGGLEGDKKLPAQVWITDAARKDESPQDRIDVTINPRQYSSDIATAWAVVERLIQQGNFSMVWRTTHETWKCSFYGHDCVPLAMQEAETVPHVICLAALEAVS